MAPFCFLVDFFYSILDGNLQRFQVCKLFSQNEARDSLDTLVLTVIRFTKLV